MEIDTERPNVLCRGIAKLGGWPLVLAWLASAVAVCLAVVSKGPYDPNLAVLTATLIAVIWYAYFTFRGVRRPARVDLRINPDLHLDSRLQKPALRPEVENKTDRRLTVRFYVCIWVDREPVPLGPFYRGERPVAVPGRRAPRGLIPLDGHLKWREERLASEEVLVAFRAEWVDELCEPGSHPTLYWSVDLREGQTSAIIDPERIREIFGPLPDSYESGAADAGAS